MRGKTLKRISARVSPDIAAKLEELLAFSGANLSEVIVKAIESYHHSLQKQNAIPAQVLKRNKFIGCSTAQGDLSQRYKRMISESLRKKT